MFLEKDMKDLIKDTIGKIKKQHILPESKWKYLARKYGVWFLFVLVVIFGGVSLSAAAYLLSSLDWDLYNFMHQNRVGYLLSIFPYFWAVLVGTFIIGAFFDMRKTETGYRFSWLKISLVTIGSILVLGAVMFFAGLGGRFNSMMASGVPYYGQHMMVTKESQWMQPQDGFLAGTINSTSNVVLVVSDLNGKVWNVDFDENTLIRPSANVSKGQMIKIIGTQSGSDTFQATEIRPWIGGGMMGGVGGQRNGMGTGRGMMRGN
ncbi:MAG TPA: hypothetical protein DEA89_00815 [Candidatus Moranbacteria bacterium]|nr:hypothetical protein [Candidatus Moranbacteria bacterium]HBI51113.1 hypothetical protein [Candidatus Moranbacteria bacterium]HBU10448.1 hypothetical protein [Candidatus Moranbacteria bacterium]HCO99126.1 hypothetical protein [Candidatus Moranbacteria bacterium]